MSSSSHRVKRRSRIWSLLFWTVFLTCTVLFARPLLLPADSLLYKHAGQSTKQWTAQQEPQLVPHGQKVIMEKIVTEHRTLECPTVGVVELDYDSCAKCFAALPLGPQDLAVLLNKLSSAGVSAVGISSPLTWQQESGDMVRELICRVIRRFDHPVVGLRGRTAAQADFTPLVLRDSSIPTENIEGDATGLPSANRPLPNSLTDTPDSVNLMWAPDRLEDELLTHKPSAIQNISFPLLMRWNGETIPTLPLRLALQRRGLSPADVKVRIGQDIRFGGITLPLDAHGRTRLIEARAIPITLTEIMDDKSVSQKLGANAAMILEEPLDAQGEPGRAERIARTLSQLSAIEKVTLHSSERPVGCAVLHEILPPRTPVNIAILAGGLFFFILIMRLLPGILKCGIFTALLCCTGWLMWEQMLLGHWFSVTTLVLCWIFLLPATRRKAKADDMAMFVGRKHH